MKFQINLLAIKYSGFFALAFLLILSQPSHSEQNKETRFKLNIPLQDDQSSQNYNGSWSPSFSKPNQQFAPQPQLVAPAPIDYAEETRNCKKFFEVEIGNKKLVENNTICDEYIVKDALRYSIVLSGVGRESYKTCVLGLLPIANETNQFLRDCASSSRNSDLKDKKFLKCYTELTKISNSSSSYNNCLDYQTRNGVTSSDFWNCQKKLESLKLDITNSIKLCGNQDSAFKISTGNFDTCSKRILETGISTKDTINICLQSNAAAHISSEKYAGCMNIANTVSFAPHVSSVTCANENIAAKITNPQTKNCIISGIKSTFRNNLFYTLSAEPGRKTALSFLNRDCEGPNPSTTVFNNKYLNFIKDLNISSYEDFSTSEPKQKVRLGGISGLSYDAQNNELFMLTDDNNMNSMGTGPTRIYVYSLTPDYGLQEKRIIYLKSDKSNTTAIDPEGLVRTKSGKFIISSETGDDKNEDKPHVGIGDAKNTKLFNINVFDSKGNWLNHIGLPESFQTQVKEYEQESQDLGSYSGSFIQNSNQGFVQNSNQAFGQGYTQNFDTQQIAPAQTQKGNEPSNKKPKVIKYKYYKTVGGLVFNKSLESISLTPLEDALFFVNEGPLIQDEDTKVSCWSNSTKTTKTENSSSTTISNSFSDGNCGGSVRISKYLRNNSINSEESTGAFAIGQEYRYDLEPEVDNGVSEVLSLDNQNLLVLERSWDNVKQKITARIYLVNLEQATPIPANTPLNKNNKNNSVKKKLIIDLDDLIPSLAPGFRQLDNFEAMSFGPKTIGGNSTLILMTDNNFRTTQKTQMLVFEIKPELLNQVKNK